MAKQESDRGGIQSAVYYSAVYYSAAVREVIYISTQKIYNKQDRKRLIIATHLKVHRVEPRH